MDNQNSVYQLNCIDLSSPDVHVSVTLLKQFENECEESGVLVPKDRRFRLQHLQVVEIRGFEWRKSHIDIALYMVSIAGSFKKLIIDTWEGSIMYVGDPNKREWWVKGEEEERLEQVRIQALVLGKELPPGGECTCLSPTKSIFEVFDSINRCSLSFQLGLNICRLCHYLLRLKCM